MRSGLGRNKAESIVEDFDSIHQFLDRLENERARSLSKPVVVIRGRQPEDSAHALDSYGVSLADYEFECLTDDDAKSRASRYLQIHPMIEVWQGVRWVDRLTRDMAAE
jgi:hypothetical protein